MALPGTHACVTRRRRCLDPRRTGVHTSLAVSYYPYINQAIGGSALGAWDLPGTRRACCVPAVRTQPPRRFLGESRKFGGSWRRMALTWRFLFMLAAMVLAANAEADPCLQVAYAEEHCALLPSRPDRRRSHLTCFTVLVPQTRTAARAAITR